MKKRVVFQFTVFDESTKELAEETAREFEGVTKVVEVEGEEGQLEVRGKFSTSELKKELQKIDESVETIKIQVDGVKKPNVKIQQQGKDKEPEVKIQQQDKGNEPEVKIQHQGKGKEPKVKIQQQDKDKKPEVKIQQQDKGKKPEVKIQHQGKGKEPKVKIQQQDEGKILPRYKPLDWPSDVASSSNSKGYWEKAMGVAKVAKDMGVDAAGKAIVLGADAAGKAIGLGAEAAGKAIVLGADAAGKAIVLGAGAAGKAMEYYGNKNKEKEAKAKLERKPIVGKGEKYLPIQNAHGEGFFKEEKAQRWGKQAKEMEDEQRKIREKEAIEQRKKQVEKEKQKVKEKKISD
ncbi:neurofilament medium polypeptide-like [Raphanus sativus]|uniref:Uncharacterized protein LOC130496601 n=1 Tax=Raphanus sativus TaxID=3726 RepID=A0A9W3BZV9_RAPSA|nr:uncharacterized protein LOC130496601 [Raphanus sativus]KAJ4886471.1 neurofilament medium polypeptide-like [Raphanus sativus]